MDDPLKIRPVDERVDEVRTIEVIQVNVCKGRGTKEFPYRRVEKFFKPDGTFIGQIDSLNEKRVNHELERKLFPQLFQKESNGIEQG